MKRKKRDRRTAVSRNSNNTSRLLAPLAAKSGKSSVVERSRLLSFFLPSFLFFLCHHRYTYQAFFFLPNYAAAASAAAFGGTRRRRLWSRLSGKTGIRTIGKDGQLYDPTGIIIIVMALVFTYPPTLGNFFLDAPRKSADITATVRRKRSDPLPGQRYTWIIPTCLPIHQSVYLTVRTGATCDSGIGIPTPRTYGYYFILFSFLTWSERNIILPKGKGACRLSRAPKRNTYLI
ncbi:uncharacterized protein GGS25DRAFT_360874 [Hypoxylon fragiforme]|uniref:uncharacterized protein n=1 Tax=Hypoxylon fragiforme TaxID=63214 RepID=UPI0020C5EA22|nr:uncharacterized protein GGS25DRAFT_360874 [Hypoxylon fragiforme]KAI2605887.1 hypothetical protein GGS25DRAFT_360874 [Hypoxylon fragiforme]